MGLMDWPVLSFFKKKQKLTVYMIDEVGELVIDDVTYANNTFEYTYQGKTGVYFVDHNYVQYRKKDKRAWSMYYINNPAPIQIQHKRNAELDSIGAKQIIDSKVVVDLFSDEAKSTLTIIIILICVILLLAIFQTLITTKIIKIGA
jgi:hypothetical protein